MHHRSFAIFALALATAADAHAQRTLQSLGDDFKFVVLDIGHVWTAPFHASSSDWLGALAALGVTALTLPIDDDVDRWVLNNQESALVRDNPFRENKRFGLGDYATGKKLQPVMGALYVVGFALNSRSLRDAALGCSGMQVSNSVLRKQVIYRLVARPRPDSALAMGSDQFDVRVPGKSWAYHSFPAGHFMNAIGCASFLGNRFKLGIAEPVIYAVALGIGVARISDRRHWTSDTVLSLAMGYAIGRTIAARQLNRLNRPAGAGGSASLGADGDGAYTFSWRMSF